MQKKIMHELKRIGKVIDKAFEEVVQKKGLLYDADIVDVCSRLFSEKDFEFDKA